MTAQPQDHRPPAKQMVRDAISLQAANLLQKAQLDMMATKIILALKAVKNPELLAYAQNLDGTFSLQGEDEYHDVNEAAKALNAVRVALGMTRDEVGEARKSFTYPDERIQAVLNEATDKIAAILLDDVA